MNTATTMMSADMMPAETLLQDTSNSFEQFDLPRALHSTLAHMKYTQPTPVQAQAIPAALKGKDVLGSAQTGTGKTGAFLIPIVARLMTDPHAAALIMTPTRELASQILVVARQLLHTNTTVKTALLIGGESMGRQRAQIAARPRLVVGTPGRINDHLRSRSNIFSTTTILVLDEADRMLDMGFTPQINEVIKHIPSQNRQTLMFSATFPKEIIAFTQTYMKDPIRVTIEPERTSAANIIHESIETSEKTRYDDLMKELYARQGSIIVFVKTKHGADRIALRLQKDGHSIDVIHGGLTQSRRDRAIAGFRNKKTRIMIATDVAARGLDVPHIEHVINYDLPQVAEDYVHRIGRTARAGAEGRALSFLMPSERGKWNAIQRLLNPGQKQERGGRSDGGRGGRSNHGGGYKKRSFAPREDRAFENSAPRAEGNFKPRSNDGFKPRSNDGFKPRHNDGFKPRNNDGFKPAVQVEDGNEPNFNREGMHERKAYNPGQKRPFNRDNKRPFNGNSDNRGNQAPRPETFNEGPERNFNVDGASGEARFEEKPFRKEFDRKPAGSFQQKKKKFFNKGGKKFGGRSAA